MAHEGFTLKKLENGLVSVELTVDAATAQRLTALYITGELDSPERLNPSSQYQHRIESSSAPRPPVIERTSISSLNELENNERVFLEALVNRPVDEPFPQSRELVELVDWSRYRKSGSDDETARASSLRATMLRLDEKGLTQKRGSRGGLERFWSELGKRLVLEVKANIPEDTDEDDKLPWMETSDDAGETPS